MSDSVMGYSAMRVRYDHNAGDGWRSRLAWWLRRLAGCVDDEPTITVCLAFDSGPEVEAEALTNAIDTGLTVTYRLFREAVEAETAENLLYERRPDLIEESQR